MKNEKKWNNNEIMSAMKMRNETYRKMKSNDNDNEIL